MTEAQLQDAVIDCARLLGWRVAHFRPARTERGWRTPVSADGKGFPDLVMVRGGRLIFAELKQRGKRPSGEQQAWLDALAMVGDRTVQTFLWTPAHWQDGVVEARLR